MSTYKSKEPLVSVQRVQLERLSDVQIERAEAAALAAYKKFIAAYYGSEEPTDGEVITVALRRLFAEDAAFGRYQRRPRTESTAPVEDAAKTGAGASRAASPRERREAPPLTVAKTG